MAVAAESLAGGLYGGLILYFVIKGIVAIIDKFRD
jgi:hypothetical protein